RQMGALARRRGATPLRARVYRQRTRTALELALDNAAEGCTREAFGALVGLYQAEHATEADVKRTFAAVADDEIGHAAFSFELAKWLDGQLSDSERNEVRRARQQALEGLVRHMSAGQRLPCHDALGLPNAAGVEALAAGFRSELAS